MDTSLIYSAVNGVEYGRGSGRNIHDAKNAAAHYALKALIEEFPGVRDIQNQKVDGKTWG